ncbi:DUF1217 domain-containing protein [Mesorhizobium australicum]|uniref:DUF1217 domain-containing protein n=1 Tax=Mesorhizobium australicum TaxID=536018 RepID=A0A1X7PKC7_9HYPH|nr:DUF1217 domain-containing protein [Mesorhizobium australicum]SMH51951.1 Protein of unknown function [Mesorhizobium australicum]
MINTYVSYQLIAKDIGKSLDRVQNQPVVERETEYYLENITKVKSIKEFVADDRLFRYAMKAHGLEDMAYAKAFMVKALEGGVEDKDSFANKLSDKRYKEFVNTFNFEAYGDTATLFTKAQQGTVDKYLRQTLEENAGDQNEGVRLALYFERKASSITNAYEILADPALKQVAFTALGLPDSFGNADIDKQAKLIEERIDLEDFKDPELLSKFINRFTTLWEINNPTVSAASLVTTLFTQPEYGISTNLLLTMQSMKAY